MTSNLSLNSLNLNSLRTIDAAAAEEMLRMNSDVKLKSSVKQMTNSRDKPRNNNVLNSGVKESNRGRLRTSNVLSNDVNGRPSNGNAMTSGARLNSNGRRKNNDALRKTNSAKLRTNGGNGSNSAMNSDVWAISNVKRTSNDVKPNSGGRRNNGSGTLNGGKMANSAE